MKFPTCILLLICAVLPIPVLSHSWLSEPLTFNRRFPTKDCRKAECTNACPPIEKPENMNNSPDKPARIYQRGQTIRVCYVKNNHHGGIASFSIVPINVMNEKEYHKKFNIFKTCWHSGEVDCRKEKIECGTDTSRAFCHRMKIPNNFKSGKYVLSYQWYGGLHFGRKKGWFPDFWSCSFIEIKGGFLKCNPRDKHTSFFVPGQGPRVKSGKCHTAADKVGICGNTGNRCKRIKSFYGQPFPFDPKYSKGKPTSFNCNDVENALKIKTAAVNMLKGKCQEKVCCKSSCRKCGGDNCNRGGKGKDCCISQILRSRRHCNDNEPPCIRPEFK